MSSGRRCSAWRKISKGHGSGGSHGVGGVAGRSAGGRNAAGGKDGTVTGAGAEFASLREDKWAPNWDTVHGGDAAAEARSDKLASSLTPEQKAAIQHFTSGQGFEAIRHADKGGEGASATAQAQAKAINAALAKAPKVEQTVFRGIAVNRETLHNIMRDKTITLDSMSSASRNALEARRFVSDNVKRNNIPKYNKPYGVILKIKQRSGASIDTMSHSKGEREVLLPKGMRLRVTKLSRTSVVAWEGRTPTLVVHAEEI